MDIIVKFLFYSGRYIIVVTTQSLIEALKRTSQINTKIMEGIDKSFEVIGSHENMLQLFNENIETIGGNSGIQLAFISDRHKVEFEKYLKNLEKSVHGMERNGKLNNIFNEELIFPNHNQTTSNIINRYTIKNVSVEGIFPHSPIKHKDETLQSNDKDEHIDGIQEIFYNDDASWNNTNMFANSINVVSSEPLSSRVQNGDEDVSINNSDNDLTEQLYTNRSKSSELFCEFQQDSPIMSQLFDYDTKTLASVIVTNSEKKINYFVKNSITEFCKDLELNLHGLRNKKARNLLTTSNSNNLIKKLISNKKDATISHNILNNLVSKKSEDNEIKCNDASKEETRNDDKNSAFQIDFENTGKLLHQNMESFKVFERRLHDIHIKRQLDEIRNDRIREIHNIKGGDEFSASNEKRLQEKAMKEVIKDLSHNLDITMKKLASNETRFKTIEKKLKHLEQMSISSAKSNVSDLLNEINANHEKDRGIELLSDDVKKIELEVMTDESKKESIMNESNMEAPALVNEKSSNAQSRKSEIPIFKTVKTETTLSTNQILPEANDSQDNEVDSARNKFRRKLNKEISPCKKTYFHHIKETGTFSKSKPNQSRKNYKEDILKKTFKNYPTSLPKNQVDKITSGNFRLNRKTSNSNTKLKFNPKNELLKNILWNRENSATTKKAKHEETTEDLKADTVEPTYISAFRAQASEPKMHFPNTNDRKEDEIDLNVDEQMPYCHNTNIDSIMESYRLYAHALNNEPIDSTLEESKEATIQKQDTDARDVDVVITDKISATSEYPMQEGLTEINDGVFSSSDVNKNTQFQLTNDNFDQSIADQIIELDDGNSILSIDKINQIEDDSDIQNLVQQLNNKIDNFYHVSTSVDSAENDEMNSSKSIQSNDKTQLESTKTVEELMKKSLKVDHVKSKDATVDYINAVNNAYQNNPQIDEEYSQNDYNSTAKSMDTKSKQNIKPTEPIFSTIDPNIYNDAESEEKFEYKDAVMTNNISIKKPPIGHSEILTINEFGNYEIKKTTEDTKNTDAKISNTTDRNTDYEPKKACEPSLSSEIIPQRDPCNYEVQKLQEHMINVDKAKSFQFIPIEGILKSELKRCCIGRSAQSKDLFDIDRDALKNDPIRDNICDKFRTFNYEAFKAFEHLKSIDASSLSRARDCTIRKENKQLKISPTLSWDSEGCMKDFVDRELDDVGEQSTEVEKLNSLLDLGVKENANNSDYNKLISDGLKRTPEKLSCITKENDNALETILQNINDVINDKSVTDNTTTTTAIESFEVDNVVSSSKTCIGLEQKYKRMCDLLISIKNTIKTHKMRVEQTVRNYEDLFKSNTVDTMVQKHSDYKNTTLCYELVNYLDNQRANFIRNGNAIEEFDKKISNIYDTQTNTLLINRENFKILMIDFKNTQKRNEDSLQRFYKTIENIESKPKSKNKLHSTQCTSFLDEYSKQISELNQEITVIADANKKQNEIVNKNDDKTNDGSTIMQPSCDISKIKNSSDMSMNLVEGTEVQKGVFENQISKLSIETEKNQSSANRNIPRTSTKISMPMLQKENLEIDKMIEANKKAFADLESTLKVVKLIAKSSQNNLEEPSTCAITKCYNEDCTVNANVVTFSSTENNNLNSLMSLGKPGQTNIDVHDFIPGIENQRNMIFNENFNDEIKTQFEQTGESKVDIQSENNIPKETKTDDSITTVRKGSNGEFQSDKHGTQSSLKHHEVKKKEYHTRCSNKNKDSEKEDKDDTVVPTALIVTHNTEIPIQMMPMAEDSIYLNNFNIEKSLINFQVPRKELITVGVDDSRKENYLKESIIENVFFKNLIKLEDIKKFFKFNEPQNASENNNKKNVEKQSEATATDNSNLTTDELNINSVDMQKENGIKLLKHSITKSRINMESINKIKEQSMRKKHLESKPIDTRTRKEIEKSITLYKQKSRKKRALTTQNVGAAMDNSQYVIDKLKSIISRTKLVNTAANSKTDSTTNDSKPNIQSELVKQVAKLNVLSLQNVPQQTIEATTNTVGLKITDQKEPGITFIEGEKAAMHIEKLLKTSEDSIETKHHKNSRTDNMENQEENKKILELSSKSYVSASDFHSKLEGKSSYELKKLNYNDTNIQDGTYKSKSEVTYANSLKQNQNKYKVSQFQKEYIYIEPNRDDANRRNMEIVRKEKATSPIKVENIIERNEKNFGYEERGKLKIRHLQSEHNEPKLYPNQKSITEQRNVKRDFVYTNKKHIERGENVTGKREQNNIKTVNEQAEYGVQGKVQKQFIHKSNFKISSPRFLQIDSKQEEFRNINGDNTQQFPPHLSVIQNTNSKKNSPLKSSESESGIIVTGNTKKSKTDLADYKQKNTIKMRNHLKLLTEVNMNSAKIRKKFENIYEQIEKFDPKYLSRSTYFQLKAWAPVQKNETVDKTQIEELEEVNDSSAKVNNVPLSDSVYKAYPKNLELFNQINTIPQKTMWNPHNVGRKKMWKRLQHIKKIASEKNANKFYVLGTKLPTLSTNTARTAPRVSERLLPYNKPKQYQYQIKKVKVGERMMNITYLVEVKESKFQ